MSFETSALLLSWVAIAILSFAVSGLIRQVRYLSAGSQAPTPRRLGPPTGAELSKLVPQLGLHADDALLVFADADCEMCEALIDELKSIRRSPGGRVHVLYRDAATKSNGNADLDIRGQQIKAFEALSIPVTPFGVVIKSGKVDVATPLGSVEQLRHIVAEVER